MNKSTCNSLFRVAWENDIEHTLPKMTSIAKCMEYPGATWCLAYTMLSRVIATKCWEIQQYCNVVADSESVNVGNCNRIVRRAARTRGIDGNAFGRDHPLPFQ
eukprot:2659750-Amphidinium_carterae.1